MHIVFEFCYQLYAVDKEPAEKLLADISLAPDEFSTEELHKRLVLKWPAFMNGQVTSSNSR